MRCRTHWSNPAGVATRTAVLYYTLFLPQTHLISMVRVCSMISHCFSTREDTLPLKCLLPGMHWRYLFHLRFRRDIDEDGLITGQRFGNDRTELIRIGNAHAANAECFSYTGSIHFIGEIDTEIPFVIVETLKHLNPSKAAVIEQDDGDRQMQAGNGGKF